MPFAREAFTVASEMFTDVHRDAGRTRRGTAMRTRFVPRTNVRIAIHTNTCMAMSVRTVSIDATKVRVISSAMYRVQSGRFSRSGNAAHGRIPSRLMYAVVTRRRERRM